MLASVALAATSAQATIIGVSGPISYAGAAAAIIAAPTGVLNGNVINQDRLPSTAAHDVLSNRYIPHEPLAALLVGNLPAMTIPAPNLARPLLSVGASNAEV